MERTMNQARAKSLWRQPGFLNLWSAQTVSAFGDQITMLALPLLALTTLDASAGQMGLLRAAETAPILVVGLIAGVWVDRLRRRPVLIAADLGRAFVLLTVPIAAWLDLLRIELLYVVGILLGTFSVCFEVARQSYVTSVVKPDQLVDANAKIMISSSGTEVAGPGVAGAIIPGLGRSSRPGSPAGLVSSGRSRARWPCSGSAISSSRSRLATTGSRCRL